MLGDLTVNFYQSLFEINKSFKLVDSKVGLLAWRHIHPRTLRDKIYFILRHSGKPMHFVDIANQIVSSGFDKKTLNMQAIHNELIRHGDFVLIGRGIYALKEWGYQPGVVKEVIRSVLERAGGPLSREEIIERVKRERYVKDATIIVNLQDGTFRRNSEGKYSLK